MYFFVVMQRKRQNSQKIAINFVFVQRKRQKCCYCADNFVFLRQFEICMKDHITAKEILDYANSIGRLFSVQDLHDFFKDISKERLYWHLNRLVKKNILMREDRGKYKLYKEDEIEPEIIELNTILGEKYPYIRYCLWNGRRLSPFMQHIAINNAILIDVEKDAVENVFYFLQSNYKPIFLNPDDKMMDSYIDLKEKVFIVKTLVSESPIYKIHGVPVPTLEKILVDILSDAVFYYLRGSETFNVYRNIFEHCPININRLLRYARRRNREKEIISILKDLELSKVRTLITDL